jgi:hypothetical protein
MYAGVWRATSEEAAAEVAIGRTTELTHEPEYWSIAMGCQAMRLQHRCQYSDTHNAVLGPTSALPLQQDESTTRLIPTRACRRVSEMRRHRITCEAAPLYLRGRLRPLLSLSANSRSDPRRRRRRFQAVPHQPLAASSKSYAGSSAPRRWTSGGGSDSPLCFPTFTVPR